MDIGNPPLRRSRDKRMIAGVMGGIAEHFDLDVTLLRVIYVLVSILSAAFPGAIVYLLLWLLIPARRSGDAGPVRA
jgi:phage shock protein PspC (stress-responsive transcriptional regulator)